MVPICVPDSADGVQNLIEGYRKQGPDGLQQLLAYYDQSPDPKLIPIIDEVAGQRGAVTSRLFWYTDFDQARVTAATQHKPILYLRMLGKLTDEYSCANSRFFRTVLYANAEVSRVMREQYILVWVSERPVPVVTIDYGDGRVLKCTITGNSIHYIITSGGQIVDALPGLYDPKTFVNALTRAQTLASYPALTHEALAAYTDRNMESLRTRWHEDARRAAPQLLIGVQLKLDVDARRPDARVAMTRAVGKTAVEWPVLAKVTTPSISATVDRSIDLADDLAWRKIAALHEADAELDASSIAVIRGQNPQAYAVPGVLEKTVVRFQQNIALDTVHNNYQLRRQILSWLRESPGSVSVEDLNRRVYAELFLTPKTDPWLGLVPDATYSALCNDGCTVARN